MYNYTLVKALLQYPGVSYIYNLCIHRVQQNIALIVLRVNVINGSKMFNQELLTPIASKVMLINLCYMACILQKQFTHLDLVCSCSYNNT